MWVIGEMKWRDVYGIKPTFRANNMTKEPDSKYLLLINGISKALWCFYNYR